MPELPEVETVRRQLDERLRGAQVVSICVLKSGREFPRGEAFERAVIGRTVKSIERRAKLLAWRFDDGTSMIAHLKMTGRFVFVPAEYVPQKHDRIVFQFVLSTQKDPVWLVWSDIRQFGFMNVVSEDERNMILSGYGPEPLETEVAILADCLPRTSTRAIKTVLLDQTVIAGVGNIYADEACHRAGIRPTRRVKDLSKTERLRLSREIKTILSESVAQQGTSAHDYVDTHGEPGGFLAFLRVYGRAGKLCAACGAAIRKIVLGQRGTHYCPTCQH